jgi:hypothetical protein
MRLGVDLQCGYFTGSKYLEEAIRTDNFVQQMAQSVTRKPVLATAGARSAPREGKMLRKWINKTYTP